MIGEASTAIEAARPLVPSWVTWVGSVVYLVVIVAVSQVVANSVRNLALRPFRKLGNAHWTERARAAFPLQYAFVFVSPILLVSGVGASRASS